QAKVTTENSDGLALASLKAKLEEAQATSKLDRKPRLINHTEARYTDDAREKGIEGKVVLGFTVDHDGIPQGIQIKRSLYPSLDQASIEAVREWRFEPAMKNGQPVSMWMEAEMDFRISQDPQKREEREARERRQKEEYQKALTEDGKAKSDRAEFGGQEYKLRLENEGVRRAERQAEEK